MLPLLRRGKCFPTLLGMTEGISTTLSEREGLSVNLDYDRKE